jgi:hypothetical protein
VEAFSRRACARGMSSLRTKERNNPERRQGNEWLRIVRNDGGQGRKKERKRNAERRSISWCRIGGCGRASSGMRSPLGVPPRRLRQRTNAAAQLQLRASWDGTSQEQALPVPGRHPVQRVSPRRPVMVPVGRICRSRPGAEVTNRRPREPLSLRRMASPAGVLHGNEIAADLSPARPLSSIMAQQSTCACLAGAFCIGSRLQSERGRGISVTNQENREASLLWVVINAC